MGEIINFDFNKNKKIETSVNEEVSNTEWWKENEKQPLLFIKFAKFLISEDAKKIKNLPTTPEAFSQSQQIVKDYTTKQLMDWFNNSNEQDWQVKPSFFRAIIEELKSRTYDKNQWIEQ